MNESASTARLASVIVLRVQEFTGRPVAEQTSLKSELEALIALAIRPLSAADRLVLEAPDGAAIVVLSSPKDALDVAQRAQVVASKLPLCIGVNYGPVKPASDANRGPGLIGDGLAAGLTLANAATPGRLITSRSFHEALEALAPSRASDLTPAGVFTDPSIRTHELFTLDQRTILARRRRLIAVGALSVAIIIGVGIAARAVLQRKPALPAVIEFEIKPRGDVFIDGVLKGRSPPLKRIEITPGQHTIEVHNPPFPPLIVEVNPASAEEMTISHTFASPKGGPRSSTKSKGKDSGGVFQDLRRQLGL